MSADPICECRRRESQHAPDGGCDRFKPAADQMEAAALRLADYPDCEPVVPLSHAQRIRDEAVDDLRDRLIEWEQFADDLARYAGIADPTKATCPEIVMALGKMLKDANAIGESAGFHKGQLHGYDAAQEEGLKLVAVERANHAAAASDLAALVDVARKAVAQVKVAGGVAFGVDVAIEPLERFLDLNHPVDGERPRLVYFVRRVDTENVDGDLEYCWCAGPDDWSIPDDTVHDRGPVVYEIVTVGPVVATRTYGAVVRDVEGVAS